MISRSCGSWAAAEWVRNVASVIDVRVPSDEGPSQSGSANARVDQLCIQGFGFLQDFDRHENVESAVTRFTEALAMNPDHAKAHGGIGQAYWLRYKNSSDQSMGQARPATLPYRHAAGPRAEINPRDGATKAVLAGYLAALGEAEEAKALLKECEALIPESWRFWFNDAGIHSYYFNDFDTALASARQVIRLGGPWSDKENRGSNDLFSRDLGEKRMFPPARP